MNTVNHAMMGLGYFYAAALIRAVGWAFLEPTWRKWRYEHKNGKGSYGAVMFLAGLKKLVDEKQKDNVS